MIKTNLLSKALLIFKFISIYFIIQFHIHKVNEDETEKS